MRMNNTDFLRIGITVAAAGLFVLSAQGADEAPIRIEKTIDMTMYTPPTPIAITGFSGEVAHVLNFDLTVMGFTNVPAASAQYVLSGNNTGNVQGQLSYGKNVLFSKIYSGASARGQAHRLADDVVLKITGVNGIAETKIAYKRVTGSRSSEIYISDFDGYNARPATQDNTDAAAPCWVPGRMAIYYTSYKLGSPNIFFQDLTTGQRHNFSHYPGLNSSAAVAADGRVAMILSKSGSPDLYVCDASGSGLKQLTDTPEDESSPCWSPDGRAICYAAKVSERRALWRISPEGGTPVRIHTSGVSNPSEPDWSPDGKWIVFTSQNASGFDLCVVEAGGGTATTLVSGEDASWAPNSRTVVYVRGGRGGRHLWLLDVPTRQTREARGEGSNSQPSWAR